jgi:hypothetical protein
MKIQKEICTQNYPSITENPQQFPPRQDGNSSQVSTTPKRREYPSHP